ncbi:MAG: beta-ketoacyl-[acyl-carrier-protein] synthase family protein [Gemmataceae bacterium]|nr:beta-ketoacyl-[acyl-carrier-protein] synthase family protein [Gemmataceae bacterium]
MAARRAVITGIGVSTPLGLDAATYWAGLIEGRSGVRPLTLFDASQYPVTFGGELPGFEPRKALSGKEERKALKMMARPITIGVACASAAFADAGLAKGKLDPDRFGVEFGSSLIPTDLDDLTAAALASSSGVPGDVDYAKWGKEGIPAIQPLWMLKYLPNMVACHTSILHDARGPNNSITETDVAGLLAMGEAFRILQRDCADFFLCGASDSKLNILSLARHCLFADLSKRNAEPAKACRPFDRGRDGWVVSEGAGVFGLEELEHAKKRGARIDAELVGFGSAFDRDFSGDGILRAAKAALKQAGIEPSDLDHVNAHGQSTLDGDAWEARGIAKIVGRDVPVFAPKSYLGCMSSAGAPAEVAASILAFRHGTLPATLNYETPDPACPIQVSREPRPITKRYFLKLSMTELGQVGAAVFQRWEGN